MKNITVLCNLSNGNQEQVELIGDNVKILEFISNYEGNDLGNDLILQDFINEVIFTDVILESDVITNEKLIECGFIIDESYNIKELFLFEYGDSYFVLDKCNDNYHVKLSNHCFNHNKQVGLGMFKKFSELKELILLITGFKI